MLQRRRLVYISNNTIDNIFVDREKFTGDTKKLAFLEEPLI
jgi:hypothetical protein